MYCIEALTPPADLLQLLSAGVPADLGNTAQWTFNFPSAVKGRYVMVSRDFLSGDDNVLSVSGCVVMLC